MVLGALPIVNIRGIKKLNVKSATERSGCEVRWAEKFDYDIKYRSFV